MGIVGELYETRRNCRAVDLIEEQQKKVKEYSTVWLVGEQLKAMCLQNRRIAALVEKDLESPGMGIAEAEQKIKAWADQHRSGNSCGVPPHIAEQILREFYGLGNAAEAPAPAAEPEVLSLTDFL